MHDSTKVVMGGTRSSYKVVESHKGEIEAGLAVRLKSDDTLSTTLADGEIIGVSIGKDLGGAKHSAICKNGLEVPVLVKSGQTPVVGQQAAVDNATGEFGVSGESGFTDVNGIYTQVSLVAIKEDGTEGADGSAALVQMNGGL